ncbi:MAG: glycosyltransferase family 1 protein [Candidatus Delongbacteria bacterium]
MRVAIDGRAIMPFLDGIGRYSHCLIEQLRHLDSWNEYIVFVTHPQFDFPADSNFREVVLPYRYVHAYTVTHFHRDLNREGADLLFAPFFLSPPLFRGPVVLTVHDLIWVTHPELQGQRWRLGDMVKRQAHAWIVPLSLRRARALLSVSQATTAELLAFLPEVAGRVHTIPLGLDHVPVPATILPMEQRLPYLLFIGNSKPYKNMAGVIRCFDLLVREAGFSQWRLKIPGRRDSFRGSIQRLLDDLDCRDRVDLLGPVSEENLAELYGQASLLLFPSRMEGFGFPVLEAMRHGTPVVTSNRSSLPEVAGGCAQLVDPDDVPAMARACAELLGDVARRQELSARGLEHAAGFRWENTARATLAVLRQAADGRMSPGPR